MFFLGLKNSSHCSIIFTDFITSPVVENLNVLYTPLARTVIQCNSQLVFTLSGFFPYSVAVINKIKSCFHNCKVCWF